MPLKPSSPQSKQELNFNNETYRVGVRRVWFLRVFSLGTRGCLIDTTSEDKLNDE